MCGKLTVRRHITRIERRRAILQRMDLHTDLQSHLQPYTESWDDDDPHANFKAEVAAYSQANPLATLEVLSQATGIPIGSLVHYVLARWAGSGADALMQMEPVVFQQMQELVEKAEAAGTDQARLDAYEGLRQIVSWLRMTD